MNFIIIHGVYANPSSNWFPWIKIKLENLGYTAAVPKFPTPLDQTLESWMRVIKKYEDEINSDTILIGHSLGAAFILSYLEQADKKMKAAYLIGGFHKRLKHKFDNINSSFIGKDFIWKKIKTNCGRFTVISSDNDPYIPKDITDELAGNLNAELIIISGGKHLNSESGYGKFEKLLDIIKKDYLDINM